MSDTPRTDAATHRVAGPNAWDPQDTEAVHASFARELERELATANRERDKLAAWKAEALTVESWWKQIDEFVRSHSDAPLGCSVSGMALEWLAERDMLLRESAAKSAQFAALTGSDSFAKLRAELEVVVARFDPIVSDRDRYGRALDNISATANRLYSHLHGGKCDGPRNKTEVVLLDISAEATAALNGTVNPRER